MLTYQHQYVLMKRMPPVKWCRATSLDYLGTFPYRI